MSYRKGPSIYIRIKSKSFKLILKGFKVLKEDSLYNNKENYTYNKYKASLLFISISYVFLYFKHNYLKFEFQKMKKPNILIPEVVYKIRKEHYIYWEKSRLARGLSTTFSYYNYDNDSKMLNITDINGKTSVQKLLFKQGSESKEVLENPYMELIYKKSVFDEEKANLYTSYYNNVYNKYDLDTYLLYKKINIMDIVRVLYNKFMLYTGIADTYRNEQYLGKFDIIYNIEKLKIVSNLNNSDRDKVNFNISIILIYSLLSLYYNIKSMFVTEKNN